MIQLLFLEVVLFITHFSLLKFTKLKVHGYLVAYPEEVPRVIHNIQSFGFAFLVDLILGLAPAAVKVILLRIIFSLAQSH